MKISTLIVQLVAIQLEVGDCEMGTYNTDTDGWETTSEVEILTRTEYDDSGLGDKFVGIS